MATRKAIPPRNKVPKGALDDIDRPPEGRKPGPKEKTYKLATLATPTQTSSTSSDIQTPTFVSRLHPSLSASVDGEEAPRISQIATKGSTPAHLSRPQLFPTPLPPSLQDPSIANMNTQADRFLHNAPDEEDDYDQIPTASWLAYKPEAAVRTPGLTPLKGWLQTIKVKGRSEYREQSWKLEQLPMVFDSLHHDYNVRSHSCSSHAVVDWLSPSGLYPADIRSRLFRLHLRNPADAIFEDKIVWRSEFRCSGACQRVFTDKEQIEWTPAEELSAAARRRQKAYARQQINLRKRGHPGSSSEAEDDTKSHHPNCVAKLYVLITVKQALSGECTVMMKTDDSHPPVTFLHGLSVSNTVRDELHIAALRMGMTSARLKIWFETSVMGVHRHVRYLQENATHRLPTLRHYDHAIKCVRDQQRTHIDPLMAIEHLVTRNPDLFLDFTHKGAISPPGRSSKDKLPLSCIIAPAYALDNAILWGHENGLFMDSSWRNKNAHKAPMTVLATHDDHHRMVPVAVMISQHGGSKQYLRLLRKVTDAIQERAAHIIKTGKSSKPEAVRSRILANCMVIAEDEFMPPFVMIDGCNSERKAIDRMWPHIKKRVCQFHLMQAIRNFTRTLFRDTLEGRLQVDNVLDAIRKVQRCPDEELWDEYHAELATRIATVANDNGQAWARLSAYLRRHWFSDLWRPYCIDYGLPLDAFRDGAWSTNNYVEATFRTFDRVLLCGRANKRLDRLVVIIISYYFPFYEHLPPNKSRPDPNFMQVLARGFNCWQANAVSSVHLDSEQVPLRLQGQVALVFKATCGAHEETHFPHQLVRGLRGLAPRTLGRWQCTCERWALTGKQCEHLWASGILHDHGPVDLLDAATDLAREANAKEGDEDEDDGNSEDAGGDEDVGDDDNDADDDTNAPDIPGDNQRLGFSEEAKPEEDQVDLAKYWAMDVIAKGTLSGIETISAARTLYSAHKVPPGALESDIKPLPKAEDPGADTDSMSNGSEAEEAYSNKHPRGSQSGNPPGPSPGIRPLNARRTKATASSMRMNKSDREMLLKPGGIKNTGEDCFASSILQVLANQPEWTNVFASAFAANPKLSNSVLGICLNEVMLSLAKRETRAYPLLNAACAEAIGQGPGQHDPAEVFRGLLNFLDRMVPPYTSTSPRSSFAAIIGVEMKLQYMCDGCLRQSTVDQDGKDEYDEMILQALPGTQLLTVDRMILSAMKLDDSLAIRPCRHPQCGRDVFSGLETSVRVHGQLLVVEVAAAPDPTSRMGRFAQDFRSFDLRSTLVFGQEGWAPLDSAGKIEWDLTGIICRQGSSRDQGHYTAMLLRGTSWWEADDERVTRVKSILAAFEGLRSPRLLIYQRRTPSPPHGTGKRARQEPAHSDQDSANGTGKKKKRGRREDSASGAKGKRGAKGKPANPIDVDADQDGTGSENEPIIYNMDPTTLPLRSKPAGSGTVPPFNLALSTHEDAWLERYTTICWPLRNKVSLLNGTIRRPPVNPKQFQALSHTLSQAMGVQAGDLQRLLEPDGWLSSPMIAETAHSLDKLRQAAKVERTRGQAATYAPNFMGWALVPGSRTKYEPILCSERDGPAPSFVGNPDWRSKRIVSYFNISHNEHWIAIIIFGPERLVVPYDSLAGRVVDPIIAKLWTNILRGRLDYELRMGWVKPKDNEHWIVAPNTERTALALGWPQQPDGSSCGVITIAALCSAIQGIKPSGAALGIPPTKSQATWTRPAWNPSNSVALRSSIFGFYMAYIASEPSSRKHWDLSKVKDAELFVQSLRPWMFTKEQLDIVFDR